MKRLPLIVLSLPILVYFLTIQCKEKEKKTTSKINEEPIVNSASFEDFQTLFKDISIYLGDEDIYVFPLNNYLYENYITKKKPISNNYKKFLNTS